MGECSEALSPLAAARLKGLRVLVAAGGRARRAIVTELIPATADDGLSRSIGFISNALAQRLVDAGLAEPEPSGEFVRITEAGRRLVSEGGEAA